MYRIVPTTQFKRDVRQAVKQDKDINELNRVVDMLAAGETLPEKYRDHLLTGNWRNHRECHIAPDWLLI